MKIDTISNIRKDQKQMMLRSVAPAVNGLIVSIHDVSPHTWPVVQAMCADLNAWGVGRISHLVIPDHHERGEMHTHPDFAAWMREKVAVGHEVVAHGYYHRRPPSTADGAVARWITSTYTAGEGEFFDLSEDEANRRAATGHGMFRAMGLHPTGFIAPAWLLGGDAARGVQRAGYDYTTRLGTIDDWQAGVVYQSQSLVYSVRAGWRRGVSLLWNESLAIALQLSPVIRLGLHPPDWKFPAIRAHAERCIARALAAREAMTYDGWLQRQRAISIGS